MRMNLREIYFEEEIYPRGQMSQKTIDSYTEALKCGATFPPLKVQKVCYKNNGKEDIKTVCLDGKHRYRSYEEFNKSAETQERIKEIDVDEWRDEVLDYENDFISLLLQSAAFNKEHGDRISDTDCKKVARSVARADMVQAYSNDQIGSFLGKTGRTISDYIADIRAEQTAIRDEIIYRLSLLGWTGEETAEVTGLSRQRIEQIATSGNISKISNSIGEWLGKKRSVEEAAKKLEISAALAWAIHLQDVEDEKRMDKLSITVKKYTSWNYVSAHPLMGKESFNGRIPGDIIVNFLYWFTKQNDLVVDPMAGSGTTADACLLMGRRCYAFDLRNETERKDVRVNNILDGYPDVVKRKKVDAIFVNPPYWGLVNYDEREDNQKVEGELSAIPLQEYYSAIEKFAKDSYAVLKQDGHLGIIIADQTTRIAISEGLLKKKDVGMALDHCGSIHRYFENAGFLFNTRILCAMPTEGLDNFMRAENEWHQPANITRELLVYIKK